MKIEPVTAHRRITHALAATLLFFVGCGQQRTNEAWSERPGNSRSAKPHDSPLTGQRYDLSRDEDRGGHTLRKHVGRTDDQLRERLDHEREISAASTWTDRAAAEETVGAAINSERQKIASWQQRGERRPNLALHFAAGHVIGRSLVRGSDQSVSCTAAVVVLRADGESFYVLTTYPEARE